MTTRRATGMKPREHVWVLIAIVFLAIGTFVALTRQQQNFSEHKDIERSELMRHAKIDKKFCKLAIRDRKLTVQAITAFMDNPGISEDVLATLSKVKLDAETVLVETEANCSLRHGPDGAAKAKEKK